MAQNKVVLWGVGTMRTHRTLWLAEEMGIDYEVRPIGPRTGETKTPEFLAINPRHKVPTMVHGDIRLTESAAILNYLTESFPTPEHICVPGDALERARLLEWCFFVMCELDAIALYTVRRHGDLVDVYGASPIAVRAAIDYFNHQLVRMEERVVRAGAFLMGEKISIADILFMSCLDCAQRYEIAPPDYLRDYRTRMRARPAYAATYPLNYGGRAVPEV